MICNHKAILRLCALALYMCGTRWTVAQSPTENSPDQFRRYPAKHFFKGHPAAPILTARTPTCSGHVSVKALPRVLSSEVTTNSPSGDVVPAACPLLWSMRSLARSLSFLHRSLKTETSRKGQEKKPSPLSSFFNYPTKFAHTF
jgi:hypothetical protein